ncbi:hypothetical protein B566_EDAN015264 [Ephemera danica]|nr:hypothetical protein B566_EDAN015264 [Ephemera danica]
MRSGFNQIAIDPKDREKTAFVTHRRLKEYNLSVNPKKLVFCRRSLKFLGRICSEKGVAMNPDKLAPMLAYLRPEDKEQLSTAECEDAFTQVKKCLTEAPILVYPSWDHEFSREVDASDVGLGACLFQEKGGVPKEIAYASKMLNKSVRYDFDIKYTKGKLNVVSDAFSGAQLLNEINEDDEPSRWLENEGEKRHDAGPPSVRRFSEIRGLTVFCLIYGFRLPVILLNNKRPRVLLSSRPERTEGWFFHHGDNAFCLVTLASSSPAVTDREPSQKFL